MRLGYRIVVPFLPNAAESELHTTLIPGFDWIQALRMCTKSAAWACRCPVHVLTSEDANLPPDLPVLRVKTEHTRLMLWLLEVCTNYIRSPFFDRPTVMLDVDQLVFRDLEACFQVWADAVFLIRPFAREKTGMPLLNGIQFWNPARHGRGRLCRFYEEALRTAEGFDEDLIRWGADQSAVLDMIRPIEMGIRERYGAQIAMVDSDLIHESLNEEQIEALALGRMRWPAKRVMDFRWTRKQYMEPVYRALLECLVDAKPDSPEVEEMVQR